ncbi:hypothetical protein ACFYQA_17445 [Streptomyces sp. NPDC005774]|uniref:hypothetical protein n=1 Tax=Streptomyces sp. NPDC005774 TaxID=3364728 RepID=UPI00368A88CB
MTAIEETGTAPVGKSTQDGGLPLSVGDATRTLTLPHLPYADAVHTELKAVGLPPMVLEVGVRQEESRPYGSKPGIVSVLFMRLVWPAGSPALGDSVRHAGLTLVWSHVTGWTVRHGHDEAVLLGIDPLASPEVLAFAARFMARHRLPGAWEPPAGVVARWSEAVYLDIALAYYEDRGGEVR